MIVTIVAIAENGCDDPDDHMAADTSFVFSNDRDDQDHHSRGDTN